jgi:signal transduction histidine kinase
LKKSFRVRLASVPIFCVVIIALFYTLRLQGLFDSYSRLIISRKPRDTELVERAMKMVKEAGSKRTIAEDITELTTDIHRNTACLLFGMGREYPDLIVQPERSLSSKAIRTAIDRWNSEPFGSKLYQEGLQLSIEGETYHLIARRETVGETTYEFVLLSNIDRAVVKEYTYSAIALGILMSLMCAAILPTLLSVTSSIKRTRESVRVNGIKPRWYWTKEVVDLWQDIENYKIAAHLYKIQIDQSTSGQMIVRSKGMAEAIIYNPNLALAKISGHAQSELEGRPLNKIVPAAYHHFHQGLGAFDDELKRRVGMMSYAEGCPFHGNQESRIVGRDRTVNLLHKDGSIRKVVLGVYYVGKNEDETDEWVGVVTDVTELTDAIAKATEAKSENLQLIQAWSHDLKGHAKGVFDELSTLKRLKPEFKTDAERISFEAALDRSELTFKIIQNTRDLGDLEIKPQRTSTKEILDRINLIHRDKNIKYNWPETEHFIDMDIDRFISMGFNNLIENAFKYSLGSNPEVVVGLKIDKEFAKFFVQDFGLGMDEAGQAKVMAGNFGSRVRLNPQIEGTGQGIFSAKRVFKAHDAELSLKSKLGQGSIFIVKVKTGD